MKKVLSKKAVAMALGGSVVLGGANVYAASNMDQNLVSLIKTGIYSILGSFEKEIQPNKTAIKKAETEDITSYVVEKSNTVRTDLENTKNAEIKRAEAELNTYVEAKKNATGAAIDTEVSTAKQLMKKEVDSNIQDIKKDIDKELEKAIIENLKNK